MKEEAVKAAFAAKSGAGSNRDHISGRVGVCHSQKEVRDASFFADPTQVAEDTIFITGPDVNHMKHVLRMKPGEEVLISDGTGRDYTCEVEAFEPDRAVVRIHSVCDSRMELPAEIWLFQGLPKADKMELIIQKAVELGASAVVPVATKMRWCGWMKRRRRPRKKRWQAIAESAAKQSKRSRIPRWSW